ncbi:hypothetical protein B0T22DRAFT_294270 [Podospora appendiculata]|uniref:F-box domain-containing protein n=1 Tax=Podospora appendiculata TaxID=314037 RepID=A0AAE0X1D6_9PEZI|nr:hypothetical protein B0T22DRAFT_294270 [Podospora appendiculata]
MNSQLDSNPEAASRQPHLYTIPVEIWSCILELLSIDTRSPVLAPGLPLPIQCETCGYTRQDLATCINPWYGATCINRSCWLYKPQNDILVDRKAALNTLLNLYLVSKPLARTVEPFLYRTISITSGRGLARVAALLENKPHVGDYLVTRIESFVDPRSQRVIEDWYFLHKNLEHGAPVVGPIKLKDMQPALGAGGAGARGSASGGTKRRRGRHKQPTTQRPIATISWQGLRDRPTNIVHVLAGLFQRARRVDHLTCAWACVRLALNIRPLVAGHHPRAAFSRVLPPRLNPLFLPPLQSPTTSTTSILPGSPFTHLKHLEFDTGGEYCQILDHLHCFPQLETLNVRMFGGGFHGLNCAINIHDSAPGSSFPNTTDGMLPNLKHITLDWVNITEATLAGLCLACSNLETLVVRFAGSTGVDGVRLRQAPLNQALLMRHATLRCLEMISLPLYTHFLARTEDSAGVNPRESRMTCLPGLGSLRELSMHYVGLFGWVSRLGAKDVEELPARIPSSLHHLEIVCDRPWVLSDSEWNMEHNAYVVMDGLQSLHQRGLLPRGLRYLSVALDARGSMMETSRPWKGPGSIPRSRISARAALSALDYFSRTDVHFTIRWSGRNSMLL